MRGFSMLCAAALVAFAAPAAAAGNARGGGGSAGVGGPIPHSHHGNVAVADTGDPSSVSKPPPVSMQSGLVGYEPSGDWWLRHERHF